MTPAAFAETALADAARDARALASKANSIVEDTVRSARRSYKVAQHRIEDAADDVTKVVRKQPLRSVAAAIGAGLVLGVVGTVFVRAVAGRCAKSR